MKKLRWFDFISINLFWLLINIRNNSVGMIFMPYLVDIFVRPEIRNTALGGMRTAGLIIAMLVQPAAGLLSDRSTSRFGRRRPYLFIGVLLDLLFLAAIGFSWDYWSLLIAVLLFQFSSNISHGPLQGLIPDLVPEEQRGMASGVKALMELLPLILVALTVARLVGAGQFTTAVWVVGLALLAIMLLAVWLVKEEPLREKPAEPIGPPMLRVLGMLGGILGGGAAGLLAGGAVGGLAGLIAWGLAGAETGKALAVGLGGMVAMAVAVVVGVWVGTAASLGRDARRHASFTWWVVNRLMFLAAVTSIQSYAPYFLMNAFQITREAAIQMTSNLMMVVGIFTLLSSLPSGWLADRFSHHRLVAASGWVAVFGTLLLMGTLWLPSLALIYPAGVILGVAAGLFMTANWALGTALAPREQAGRYLGISNLAGAGAGMIGTGLGGPVADYLETFRPGLGYFALFASYALLFVLSVVSLRWVRKSAQPAAAKA